MGRPPTPRAHPQRVPADGRPGRSPGDGRLRPCRCPLLPVHSLPRGAGDRHRRAAPGPVCIRDPLQHCAQPLGSAPWRARSPDAAAEPRPVPDQPAHSHHRTRRARDRGRADRPQRGTRRGDRSRRRVVRGIRQHQPVDPEVPARGARHHPGDDLGTRRDRNRHAMDRARPTRPSQAPAHCSRRVDRAYARLRLEHLPRPRQPGRRRALPLA